MKFVHRWSSFRTPRDLEDVLEDVLTSSNSEGSVERARETADNVARAFAQLIQLLNNKGIISNQEVLDTFPTGPWEVQE